MRKATALLLIACGQTPPPPDGGVAPRISVELGARSIDGGFQSLEGAVEGVPGAQGGFHVGLLYRVPEGGQGSLTFEHQVRRARDGRLVSKGSRHFELGLVVQPGWVSPQEVTVFLCPTPIGVGIIDEPLRFSVTAADDRGQVLGAGEAEATFRCGPVNSEFCANVCKG